MSVPKIPDAMAIRPVPFRALGGLFEQDDVDAAQCVMLAATRDNGSFFPLPEENDFQAEFARHEGAKAAVAVNSCGTALDLCMMVLGVKPGDEVITTPLTFVCTATCASALGAKVVFADVDASTLCLDPAAVRAKLSPKTRAIIPVHFAGLAADIEGFDAITRDTGVPVIYDAAHAVGARRHGKPVGAAGLASCYSFQSNKNITTLGEGGAVTTDNLDFAEKVRQKKTFGYVYGPKLRVVTTGFNYRMTKPQLAVGVTQIRKADRINSLKTRAMAKLNEIIESAGGIRGVRLPAGINDDHGGHLYVIRVEPSLAGFTRDQLQTLLKTKYQVGTSLHYPIVWSWEAFAEIPHDHSGCPVAEAACSQVLTLPIFPQTTEDELLYLAWALRAASHELCK